ncbi:MAG TPA: MBL fold metallo-hydrolase [Terriglobales bacterium]|nr:MBL fold metallo-hydrolase [Terriglobales bacterium]
MAKNMTRIIVLGSSSGMPDPERACSSILLETERKSYLIDAGEGCASSILKHKIDPLKIKQVFITHTHADHCIGIFMLVQMMHLLENKENIEIYLPEESVFWFENMFDALYFFHEKLKTKFELKPYTQDLLFKDKNLILRAHPNRHLLGNKEYISEENLPNKMESYCFSLELGGNRIVYSGDIADMKDIEDLIEEVDLFFCESTHISVDKLVELVKRKKVKQTILTHIHEEVEKKKEQIIRMAEEMGYRNLRFASDGMSMSLP